MDLINPLVMKPDDLREQLRRALSELSFDEYDAVRGELINGLRRAGVNIGTTLLLIGASIGNGEVLPSDMAQLVRYLHINHAGSLKFVRGVIARLLANDAAEARRGLAA
jgi:hypothetical protein